MNNFTDILDRLRGLDPERMIGLRPPYPPVALQLDRTGAVLVRMKRKRRGLPLLESHSARTVSEECMPASIFEPIPNMTQELVPKLRELFEASGTRPGRVSLILPDNLAKISLLSLPERPASRKQMDELVRSKMRRAVPFRIDEAGISYQILPGKGREVSILVLMVRRALVERLESTLGAIGARTGLIDISTPNLINLCRSRIESAAADGGDVAVLNCAGNYFSLVILRREQLIFFRCKTYAVEGRAVGEPNGVLAREIASSFSYYREKLNGEGVRRAFVRTTSTPFEEVERDLRSLGLEGVELIDLKGALDLAEGVRVDGEDAQRLAPAIGAAIGRGGR
jgi:hypothetical protein